MRWFPSLVFSHSHSHSSNSSQPSSSSSATTLKSSPSTSSLSDRRRKHNTRISWLFGKSTRSKNLPQVADLDTVVVPLPLSRSSSTFDRSSVEPQPLPLPEISSPPLHHHNYPLPSPKDAATADAALPPGYRMRSVFASPETKKNWEQVETRSPGVVPQETCGSRTANSNSTQGEKFRINVPPKSAPTSPFASPRISPHNIINDDFVPYYYVTSKGNQFWSAPEMNTSETSAEQSHSAFFDFSALGADNITSSHQSPPGRSPNQHPKSPVRPSSPIPRLSLDISAARREATPPFTVHPLPLPPSVESGTLLPSSSATFPLFLPKTESLSMKSQWQKGKLIGRGTFGTVYAATNRETGALCAMKEAEIFYDDPKSAECIKQLEQEIKVLSHLKHPNIVQYYGSEIIEDKFYIYLEYVHPGSINKYVREHCGAITESVVRNFTRHILSGLAYLHGKKTIHRDIKGANLLVDSAGVVKLTDFGMAKHLTGHAADLSLKGSPYWMAPELMQAVIQKDNSSDLAFAIDIWSLGCTMIEMYTGKPPWSEYEGAAAMFKVMKDTPPIPETLSAEGKDFLRLCFKRNPAERPTASMLLDHRFLKNL
ncbi:hypothetical protein VNO77_40826 [Canavalia gladiata]|uniref:mitogen-activated protein kinase kinase kinase n=1 Tax=Canavalia gladiata TaxID=3824 RepID=A0AAN9PS60_CANGL